MEIEKKNSFVLPNLIRMSNAPKIWFYLRFTQMNRCWYLLVALHRLLLTWNYLLSYIYDDFDHQLLICSKQLGLIFFTSKVMIENRFFFSNDDGVRWNICIVLIYAIFLEIKQNAPRISRQWTKILFQIWQIWYFLLKAYGAIGRSPFVDLSVFPMNLMSL